MSPCLKHTRSIREVSSVKPSSRVCFTSFRRGSPGGLATSWLVSPPTCARPIQRPSLDTPCEYEALIELTKEGPLDRALLAENSNYILPIVTKRKEIDDGSSNFLSKINIITAGMFG
uniref:Uncharacterized protein n=1 Tax=Rangifer tarandus platyrhynchus TaxID=3082113 RepID=A0ACB0ESS1_RANTA|nr:unnamed protein product [Rangifer tarandus platyrhynchus]